MKFIIFQLRALKNVIVQGKNRLIYRFIGWYFLANALIFWVLGWSYLYSILSSASLFENSIVKCSNFLGKFIVCLFAVVNYLSYMMFLSFIPAIIVFILACMVPRKQFIILVSVLLASLSVVCLVIDSRVFAMYKFHLNETIIAFILSPQWREVFDFSQFEVILMSSAIGLIFLIEAIVAWLVFKKIVLAERFKMGKTIAYFWLGGVVFSYLTLMITIANNNNLYSQQIPNLPLFSKLVVYTIPSRNAEDILMRYSEQSFAQPLFPGDKMHYPLHPMHCQAPKKPYNIILIMIDSVRFDSLQKKYMPHLTQFATKAWQFQHHLSAGNATQPGIFSLFYSISSNYWTAALKQKKRPVFFEVLEKYGYDIKIIWSAEMHVPPFDETVFRGLPNLQVNGAPGDDSGSWDRYTTKEAIAFLSSKQQKNPFFLQLFYDAPHGFCSYQSFPAIFQPAFKYCARLVLSNNNDPTPFYNRYLNAVHFVDDEVGKVLDVIEKHGYLKNSIVVFTSDHGQEFNDYHQNYWGHSCNFTDAEVHVPMIVFWPDESPRLINYQTSSYDVVPTLLMKLFSCTNPTSDYSLGQNLLYNYGRLPFILAGSYINMGIIEPDRLTTLETSGRISITDTKAMPLPGAKPRVNIINRALVLLRKYF